MDYTTFEEAVKDICSQLGLSGHEAEYGQLLVDGVYKTVSGIYQPSSLLNMTPDMTQRIRNLNKAMKSSEEGRKALEKHKLSEREAVPAPLPRSGYDVNPLYLLPSQKFPELGQAMESLNQALAWEKEMEERYIKEREK